MRKNNLLLWILLMVITLSCEKPIEYKYQDKPQSVDCPGADKALMHEALYSFQEDIGAYYNRFSDFREGSVSYYLEAYRQFVFFGFTGAARYQEMVSPHSLELLEKLKEIDGLFVIKDGRYELNYQYEYIDCLFKSIADDDLRNQILGMRDVNFLSSRNIAEPMRINFQKIMEDPYLAMYMALEAYYQHVADIDFSKD